MNGDPSGLYMAITTSSAALIAIIGAFFVSTSVDMASTRRGLTATEKALMSDRSSAAARLSSYKEEPEAHRGQINAVEAQLTSIDIELHRVTGELKGVSSHPGIWPGVAVLLVFAAVGIVMPLLLMADFSKDWLALAEGQVIALLGFGLGLLLLIIYLVGIARWVTRSDLEGD